MTLFLLKKTNPKSTRKDIRSGIAKAILDRKNNVGYIAITDHVIIL